MEDTYLKVFLMSINYLFLIENCICGNTENTQSFYLLIDISIRDFSILTGTLMNYCKNTLQICEFGISSFKSRPGEPKEYVYKIWRPLVKKCGFA